MGAEAAAVTGRCIHRGATFEWVSPLVAKITVSLSSPVFLSKHQSGCRNSFRLYTLYSAHSLDLILPEYAAWSSKSYDLRVLKTAATLRLLFSCPVLCFGFCTCPGREVWTMLSMRTLKKPSMPLNPISPDKHKSNKTLTGEGEAPHPQTVESLKPQATPYSPKALTALYTLPCKSTKKSQALCSTLSSPHRPGLAQTQSCPWLPHPIRFFRFRSSVEGSWVSGVQGLRILGLLVFRVQREALGATSI